MIQAAQGWFSPVAIALTMSEEEMCRKPYALLNLIFLQGCLRL